MNKQLLDKQLVKAWLLVKDQYENARDDERGELVTWLILAAGLAVIALLAVEVFADTVDTKVKAVNLDGGGDPTLPTPVPGG